MRFKLLFVIFGFIRKKHVVFTHAVCAIVILAAFFVPVNQAAASSAPPLAFPQSWTAADPIIVSKTLQSDSLSPFVNPSGLYPAQIRKAYGIDKLAGNGAGKTIAIIDAYGDPNMATDIASFDTQFGLPAASITTYGSVVATATNWPEETALDVEWAHAIAPQLISCLSLPRPVRAVIYLPRWIMPPATGQM